MRRRTLTASHEFDSIAAATILRKPIQSWCIQFPALSGDHVLLFAVFTHRGFSFKPCLLKLPLPFGPLPIRHFFSTRCSSFVGKEIVVSRLPPPCPAVSFGSLTSLAFGRKQAPKPRRRRGCGLFVRTFFTQLLFFIL